MDWTKQGGGLGKFETNRCGGCWGEALWHLWVLWRRLDAPGFVLVERCVFCAVRREGDKVKQYRHCRPGSPLLSSLGSPRAESHDINMCVCVTFSFSTGIFLPACILRVACRHFVYSYISYDTWRQRKAPQKCLFGYMLGAVCQTDIIAVWSPRGYQSLYV